MDCRDTPYRSTEYTPRRVYKRTAILNPGVYNLDLMRYRILDNWHSFAVICDNKGHLANLVFAVDLGNNIIGRNPAAFDD